MINKNFPILVTNEKKRQTVKEFNKKLKENEIELINVKCDLCNSSSYNILYKTDCHGINSCTVVCMKCGFVYTNPRMSTESNYKFYTSDEYRNIYEGENFIQINESLHIKVRNTDFSKLNPDKYNIFYFYKFIKDANINFKSVAEIGCAGGANLIPFTYDGIEEIDGYDYNKTLIEMGRKKNLNLIQGGIESIERNYDLIFLRHVFEHFINPHDELEKIIPFVDKYLLIEVPGILNKIPKIQNAHQLYFSFNTLNYLFSKHGLKEVKKVSFPENDYIIVLYEKSANCEYTYNKIFEYFNVLKIITIFHIKQYIKKIIRRKT